MDPVVEDDEFFYDETLCGWKSDATKKTRAEKEFDPDRGITKSAGSFSRSDVMEVKMMCHPNDVDLSVGDNCNNTNLCIARLGEAYLLYAEACLASGNSAEALKYVKENNGKMFLRNKEMKVEEMIVYIGGNLVEIRIKYNRKVVEDVESLPYGVQNTLELFNEAMGLWYY